MMEQGRAGTRAYAKHSTPARRGAAAWSAARSRLRTSGYAAGVALIWLLHAAINYSWLRQDTRPPTFDAAQNAAWTVRMAHLPFGSEPLAALAGLFASYPYPPLVYWVAAPFVRVGGPHIDTILLSQLLFLGLLFFATYQIGAALMSRRAALLAVALLSFFPAIFGLSRIYLLDLPQAAVAALTVWLLLCTQRFERLAPSLAVGVALGLGVLTKWLFAAAVAGPLLLTMWLALGPQRQQSINKSANGRIKARRRRWRHVLLALALGALIGLPWYVLHAADVLRFADSQTSGSITQVVAARGGRRPPDMLSSAEVALLSPQGKLRLWLWDSTWVYYARSFIKRQVLLPFALLFLVALLHLRGTLWNELRTIATGRAKSDALSLALASVVGPYVACGLISITSYRYTVSMLPSVAIITLLSWSQIRNRALHLLLALMLAWGGAQFALLNFKTVAAPANQWAAAAVALPDVIFADVIGSASLPQAEAWPIDSIVGEVARRDPSATLLVLPLIPYFEPDVFWYTVEVQALPIEVINVARFTPQSDEEQIARSNFIVTKAVSWAKDGSAPAVKR